MTISALPTPPSRTDSPSTFADAADAFVAALPDFVTEANALATECNGYVSTASTHATTATNQATTATTQAANAAASAVSAAAAAAAAESAAGLPTDPEFGSIFRTEGVSNIKTSNFTAVKGRVYELNSSGGTFTATLPASPNVGDWVEFYDYSGTYRTIGVTVGRNGSKIMGLSEDMLLTNSYTSPRFIYRDSTIGWILA